MCKEMTVQRLFKYNVPLFPKRTSYSISLTRERVREPLLDKERGKPDTKQVSSVITCIQPQYKNVPFGMTKHHPFNSLKDT